MLTVSLFSGGLKTLLKFYYLEENKLSISFIVMDQLNMASCNIISLIGYIRRHILITLRN